MNKQLALIIETQGLDSLIIEKNTYIQSAPALFAEMDKHLDEVRTALAGAEQRRETAQKKRRDKERELEELNEKVKKLKERTNEIKTNKEYQAHLKEVEAKEKEKGSIEDGILNLMEEMDSLESAVKAAKSNIAEEQKKLDVLKKEVEREVKEREGELEGLRQKRSVLTVSIEPEVYGLYMGLLESCRGLAVVGAKNEMCTGCNMNIPPQLFVEIKKNEEIIHCPQCKRILYYKEEEPAGKSQQAGPA